MAYKELKSYQQATIIYDFTVEFCARYVSKFSRTVDQMTQAARSGKQNIVEGTAASKTSPQTELKLLGVARASFEELLEDYQDFLRQRKLAVWGKDDGRALAVRQLRRYRRSQLAYRTNKTDKTDRADRTDRTDRTYKSYKTYTTHESDKTDKTDRTDKSYETYTTYEPYRGFLTEPEQAANAMITLINQTNFLLDRQISAVSRQMEQKGFSGESQNQKMTRVLAESRKKQKEFDEYLKKFLQKGEDKTE